MSAGTVASEYSSEVSREGEASSTTPNRSILAVAVSLVTARTWIKTFLAVFASSKVEPNTDCWYVDVMPFLMTFALM